MTDQPFDPDDVDPIFTFTDEEDQERQVNELEKEYQLNKKLPIQEDFSSGYALLISSSGPSDQVTVGELLTWEQFYESDIAPNLTDTDVTVEDLEDAKRMWEEEHEKGGLTARWHFTHDKTLVRTHARSELLPITQEQFNQVVLLNHEPPAVMEQEWFTTLIKTWSNQASNESGAITPACPNCGAKTWKVHVVNKAFWTTTVVEHDGTYRVGPPNLSGPIGGELTLEHMHCLLCEYEMEIKDLPVEVVTDAYSVL